MKHILTITLALLITNFVFSQNQERCKEIAENVFEAVNKKDFQAIKPFLSKDFTIAGHKMPLAENILMALIAQLNKIEKHTLTSVENEIGVTLYYDLVYEELGKKQSLFVFNDKNKIQHLELLKIAVKTLDKKDKKIDYSSQNFIEIPFFQMQKLIVVKAKINGVERNFILDSGSPHTIINSKYIGNKEETSSSGLKGVGGSSLSGMNIEKINLDFYGIKMLEQDALTLNISHLEKDSIEIYGLIAYDLIKEYDVLFDYKNQIVTLINPDFFEKYKSKKLKDYKKSISLPLSLRGHIPVVSVHIAKRKYNMGIDCGATANLLDEKNYVAIKKNLKKITSSGLLGASKEKKEVKYASLKKLYLNKRLYKNTSVVFSDISHLNKNAEVFIDGLLGYEILSKQLSLLSYKRKELVLF